MNIALLLTVMLSVVASHAAWSPPANPSPSVILQEAEADFKARRYEDALAKHVWVYQESLKYNPSYTGVRLSFALNAWVRLGSQYPPALIKLKSIRDDTGNTLRGSNLLREARFQAFMEYASINKYLEEETKTRDLFVWLDENNPKATKELFRLAEESLIGAKEFKLCGKYITDPEGDFGHILDLFRRTTSVRKGKEFYARQMEARFIHDCSTLVALLEINGRMEEAEKIISMANKEWDDPRLERALEKAKKGEVPER